MLSNILLLQKLLFWHHFSLQGNASLTSCKGTWKSNQNISEILRLRLLFIGLLWHRRRPFKRKVSKYVSCARSFSISRHISGNDLPLPSNSSSQPKPPLIRDTFSDNRKWKINQTLAAKLWRSHPKSASQHPTGQTQDTKSMNERQRTKEPNIMNERMNILRRAHGKKSNSRRKNSYISDIICICILSHFCYICLISSCFHFLILCRESLTLVLLSQLTKAIEY